MEESHCYSAAASRVTSLLELIDGATRRTRVEFCSSNLELPSFSGNGKGRSLRTVLSTSSKCSIKFLVSIDAFIISLHSMWQFFVSGIRKIMCLDTPKERLLASQGQAERAIGKLALLVDLRKYSEPSFSKSPERAREAMKDGDRYG